VNVKIYVLSRTETSHLRDILSLLSEWRLSANKVEAVELVRLGCKMGWRPTSDWCKLNIYAADLTVFIKMIRATRNCNSTKSMMTTCDNSAFTTCHEFMNLYYMYILYVCNRLCSHRNVMVRNATARHLSSVVELIGPNRVLREFPDKVLPVAARFLLDGSQEAR